MSTDDARPPERRDRSAARAEVRPDRQRRERWDDTAGTRSTERPVTDPHGPGTTFFTNHPDDVAARERDAYGGVRFAAVFFGWLTSVALLVLLLGLLAGAGAVVVLSRGAAPADALPDGTSTTGVATGVLVLLAVVVAYLGGGYVAGRMARFDGWKQDVGVWLLAVLVALLLTGLGVALGRFGGATDPAARLVDGLPGSSPGAAALGADALGAHALGALAAGGAVVAVVALGAAVAGGALGSRYHRRVDRVGLLSESEAGEAGPRSGG